MDELISKAINGDEDAYVQAILLVQKELYNIALIKLGNIDDANDVIQETMLKSYTNIRKLKNAEYFKVWIIKILINECNKFYRKKYTRAKLVSKVSEHISDKTIHNDEFFEVEGKIDFSLAIKGLNQKDQIIMALYFSDNYSPKEISKILNININTVKSKLRRAELKIEENMRKGDVRNG